MLEYPRRPGRWRRRRHLSCWPLVLGLGWAWFGVTGAVPVALWWWHITPGGSSRTSPAHRDPLWRVDLERLRAARLGPWRTRLVVRGGPAVEIFHDEIAPADLAELRRAVKDQLAAGCSTSSRSEKPGNRIVSSERVRDSG